MRHVSFTVVAPVPMPARSGFDLAATCSGTVQLDSVKDVQQVKRAELIATHALHPQLLPNFL